MAGFERMLASKEAVFGVGGLVVALALVPNTLVRLLLLTLAVALLGLGACVLVAELQWAAASRRGGGTKDASAQKQVPDSAEGTPPGGARAEEAATRPNWRVVSVYGVKIRVQEDGSDPVLVSDQGTGQSLFPAPPDDVSSTEAPTESSDPDDEPTPPLTLSFMRFERLLHKASGKPELCCTWLVGGGFVSSDMEAALDYLDRFLRHRDTQKGFAVTFDLREMGVPSLTALRRFAQFSEECSRRERWRQLIFCVKFVISGGPTYSVAKGVLSLWLLLRPPPARTYLLTDPCQSEEDAIYWEPADNPGSVQAHLQDDKVPETPVRIRGSPASSRRRLCPRG
uniref:Uncharacterized protein n=1 Tax=Alexandrium monilatum TaxID=311494 RepID=A0A7S4R8M8_9DINO